MNKAPVITVDGPSGSGKGTVCNLLANALGWQLLDSGALYRLLGLAAGRRGIALDDEPALAALAGELNVQFIPAREGLHGQKILLDGAEVHMELRTEQAGAAASQVAALPAVRAALLQRQRDFRTEPGLIADGRDMGTVVFADAPLKVYLVASAEVRAERRYLQLKDSEPGVTLASLLEEIRARDERDMQRAVAPLKPADDAILLDSTELPVEQVLARILTEAALRGLAG
jgi:cytidylate kinase